MPTCPFCGFTGKLTAEHVFGNWLSRIGLDLEPIAHGAGPLNRVGQDLGVRPPFRQTVRVCGGCNNGWMSRLEAVAARVLTPFILGEAGQIAAEDAGAVAAWVQKTALTAMLVSSETQRSAGYGLPQSEYRGLSNARNDMQPLPASQFWVGRYTGESRFASTWVTPLTVTASELPEPDRPQGYAMTLVLGQLLLHGVRFTTPSLQVEVTTRQELPQLWPPAERVAWSSGMPVDDAAFLSFAAGKDLRSMERHIEVRPWKPATELPESRTVDGMVELPTACGKHVVYYPAGLVDEALRGRFYAFGTACECGRPTSSRPSLMALTARQRTRWMPSPSCTRACLERKLCLRTNTACSPASNYRNPQSTDVKVKQRYSRSWSSAIRRRLRSEYPRVPGSSKFPWSIRLAASARFLPMSRALSGVGATVTV